MISWLILQIHLGPSFSLREMRTVEKHQMKSSCILIPFQSIITGNIDYFSLRHAAVNYPTMSLDLHYSFIFYLFIFISNTCFMKQLLVSEKGKQDVRSHQTCQ